jgi:transcription elongation factor Elf1
MNKPQFHARRMKNGTEFQCERCGGLVVRMSGRADTDQLAYVMYCNACDIASGGWQDEEEREHFLESMTIE